jgi:enoyl-CoA hydratase
MTTHADTVRCSRDGDVLVMELNRPEVLNALDADLTNALVDALTELDAAPDLRVGVITGSGRGFCAGMDLDYFTAFGVPPNLERLLWRGARKPLIAAVEGYALAGGLELALMCDLVVASRSTRLGIPEVRVGLFAAGAGLYRLGQRLPSAIVHELALTGEPMKADEALTHGLVNRVVDPGAALAEALVLAHRIASNAPLAVEASKQLAGAASTMTEADFARFQAPLMKAVFASHDAQEGVSAFRERRPPVWTGR